MTTPLDQLLATIGDRDGTTGPVDPLEFAVIVRTQARRPRSLAEAMASLAVQSYQHFDVVVTVHNDNPSAESDVKASLDKTSLPARWRTVTVSDGGRAQPLNAGIDAAAEAGADYICFLDDDDLVTPDWLQAFARGAATAPGSIIRAITLSQSWATEGGTEPVREAGPVERPFAATFDFLAHLSHNETPICSIALPLSALFRFNTRFDDSLPVLEDWDLLMRLAMLVGVHSIPDETSLYRRLDVGNADSAEDVATWEAAHTQILDGLSASPLLLPPGSARRVASAHFEPGSGSRHDRELSETAAELRAITRSPIKSAAAFGRRVRQALGNRR